VKRTFATFSSIKSSQFKIIFTLLVREIKLTLIRAGENRMIWPEFRSADVAHA
jgi:hypothetical protein